MTRQAVAPMARPAVHVGEPAPDAGGGRSLDTVTDPTSPVAELGRAMVEPGHEPGHLR